MENDIDAQHLRISLQNPIHAVRCGARNRGRLPAMRALDMSSGHRGVHIENDAAEGTVEGEGGHETEEVSD